MNKKFKNIWSIWHAGMKTGVLPVSCQIKKHLAWRPPNGGKGRLHYSALYHATCQTCQMFKRKFVNRPEKPAFWAKFGRLSGMVGGDIQPLIDWGKLYVPPQAGGL
jgi:hypothetical protein